MYIYDIMSKIATLTRVVNARLDVINAFVSVKKHMVHYGFSKEIRQDRVEDNGMHFLFLFGLYIESTNTATALNPQYRFMAAGLEAHNFDKQQTLDAALVGVQSDFICKLEELFVEAQTPSTHFKSVMFIENIKNDGEVKDSKVEYTTVQVSDLMRLVERKAKERNAKRKKTNKQRKPSKPSNRPKPRKKRRST